MNPVILLFVGGMLEAAFVGQEALVDCLDVAASYEDYAMCVPPTADVSPHLGQHVTGDLRPKANPFY